MLSHFGYSASPTLSPSVKHIDRHQWNSLVSDQNFYNSHGWLATLEYALGKEEIFTLYGRSGLLGGCALWDGEDQPGLFYLPEYFPGLEGPWQQPFLWGGARRSTHNEIPCVRGSQRAEVLSTIAKKLALLAKYRRYYATIIPYMPLHQALDVAQLYPHARVLMHSAEASVTILSGGFDSQLRQLKCRYRARVRAEMAAFSHAGNTVEWCELDESLLNQAAKLIANNRKKYGNHQGIDWIKRIFDGQKKSSIINTAIAAVARRDNQIVGITIFYRFGYSLHARYYGSDYQTEDNDYRYFVLSYYHSLDYAAKNGINECRFSISALKAKTQRGAKIEPLAALLLFKNSPPHTISECEEYNRLFYQSYQQQYNTHLTSDWTLLN